MSTSPEAISVRFDADSMWVTLADGRVLGVPLVWFPRLLHATSAQLDEVRISAEAGAVCQGYRDSIADCVCAVRLAPFALGFVLCTNQAHISEARCGAPVFLLDSRPGPPARVTGSKMESSCPMPEVSRDRGFRFFFYSNEGDPREPVHVHIERDRCEAKFWLRPEILLA
jgi:hypothetical protein